MITIDFLLECAVGDVRKETKVPTQSLHRAMEYYRFAPSPAALLDILDIAYTLGELPRHRYIDVPFGHSFQTTLDHIRTCGNSAYISHIPLVSISVNDWCQYDAGWISTPNVIYELRKVLLTHILKDNVDPRLDEYICDYYMALIKSFIRVSK